MTFHYIPSPTSSIERSVYRGVDAEPLLSAISQPSSIVSETERNKIPKALRDAIFKLDLQSIAPPSPPRLKMRLPEITHLEGMWLGSSMGQAGVIEKPDLGFWTPIEYFNVNPSFDRNKTLPGPLPKSFRQIFIENIEAYFAPTSGLRGCVFAEAKNWKETHLLYRETPLWKTALKICSYLTLVIPALVLTAKFIIRRNLQVKVERKLQHILIAKTLPRVYSESVELKQIFENIISTINENAFSTRPTSPLVIDKRDLTTLTEIPKSNVRPRDWINAMFDSLQRAKYIKITQNETDRIQIVVKRGYTLW